MQDRIALDMFESLDRGRFRFDELLEQLRGRRRIWRPNRVTLTKYLRAAKDEREVDWNPVTKHYGLTAKGRSKLERLRVEKANVERERALARAPRYYSGSIDSLGEISLDSTDFFSLLEDECRRELALTGWNVPLALPVDASVYGSEELRRTFEFKAEQAMSGDESRKELSNKLLRREFTPIVETIMWHYLALHIADLSDRHDSAGNHRPPPTLEDILGFDLHFLFSFNGKKILQSIGKEERKRVGDRLVGAVLLVIACGSLDMYNSLLPVLERADLIDKDHAAAVHKVMYQAHTFNSRENAAGRGFLIAVEREVIASIAWEYFMRSGVIPS